MRIAVFLACIALALGKLSYRIQFTAVCHNVAGLHTLRFEMGQGHKGKFPLGKGHYIGKLQIIIILEPIKHTGAMTTGPSLPLSE